MTNPPYMLAHVKRVAEILKHPQVFEFLHVPVQSGSDEVLHGMVREYTVGDFDLMVKGLKEGCPNITIATDIICGFPGETEENHKESIDLVKRHHFPILNISQFYPRPNTPAARMPKLNSKIVKARSQETTALFDSYRTFDSMIGLENGRNAEIPSSETRTAADGDFTQLVWFHAHEDHRSTGQRHTVGHTKNHTKIIVKRDERLLEDIVPRLVRLERATKWHVEGTVVEDF